MTFSENGRRDAEEFFKYACWCMENDIYETIPRQTVTASHLPVSPAEYDEDVMGRDKGLEKSGDVVIVTDCARDDKQLNDMISRFRAVLRHKSRVVNISEYPFHGGCMGCFNCAVSGKCISLLK